MKKNHFIIAIIFAFIKYDFLMAQTFSRKVKNNDTTRCPGVEVTGVALENTIPLDGVWLTLYKKNEEIIWEEITCIPAHEHTFSFDLSCNEHYSIKISKEGYLSRLVSIFTDIPKDARSKKYLFEFEVELPKGVDSADTYYSDFPVAIISYNKTTKVFENHKKYTRHIKGKLRAEIFRQSRTSKLRK